MRPKSLAFRKFYEVFREQFYIDYCSEKPREEIIHSPELWETGKFDKNNRIIGKPILVEKFGVNKHGYLYRLYRNAFNSHYTTIKDVYAINILEYLGFRIADVENEVDEARKADLLFKQFEAKYPVAETEQFDEPEEIRAVRNTVREFYEFITVKQLKQAWNLLTPEFQNREIWEGNYERFADGYVTTRALRNIAVFNVEQKNPYYICKLFYEDEMAIYPVKGLNGLEDMTVDELDEFIRRVGIIRKDIESKGGNSFDKVPLNKLFNPAAIEYIWYECGLTGESLSKLFPKPKPVVVWRLYECTCIFISGKCYINDISPVKTYSIR